MRRSWSCTRCAAISCVVALLLLAPQVSAFAETIHLKNGKTIQARIVKQTDKFVRVDWYGVELTYWLGEILSIEGDSTVTEPTTSSRPDGPAGYQEGLAAYETHQYEKAIELLKPYADQGDAPATVVVAHMHADPYSQFYNLDEVIAVLRRTAQRGPVSPTTVSPLLTAGLLCDVINAKVDSRVSVDLQMSLSDDDLANMVTFLLSMGAEVNGKDSTGRLPLTYAVDLGELPVVRVLVANGADANAVDQTTGLTALEFAEQRRDIEIVRLLRQAKQSDGGSRTSPLGNNSSNQAEVSKLPFRLIRSWKNENDAEAEYDSFDFNGQNVIITRQVLLSEKDMEKIAVGRNKYGMERCVLILNNEGRSKLEQISTRYDGEKVAVFYEGAVLQTLHISGDPQDLADGKIYLAGSESLFGETLESLIMDLGFVPYIDGDIENEYDEERSYRYLEYALTKHKDDIGEYIIEQLSKYNSRTELFEEGIRSVIQRKGILNKEEVLREVRIIRGSQ